MMSGKRNLLKGAALALVVAGGAVAVTAEPASAYVVCDRFHCWHTYRHYAPAYYGYYGDPYYDSYYGPAYYGPAYYTPGLSLGFSFGGGGWGGHHYGGWRGGHGWHR